MTVPNFLSLSQRSTMLKEFLLALTDLAVEAKGRPSYKQADFVRLLRITFAGCLGPAGNLLEIVRKIQFRVNQAGRSEVQHGKASIGKSLEAELTGAGALPEEVVFQVPIFESGFQDLEMVGCALEVDPQTETFQLIPYPRSIEEALSVAEERLGAELTASLEGVRVFHGVP
jgi:hypothetical protein